MITALLVTLLIATTALTAICQPVTLVQDGVSAFVITHAPDAPPSVIAAAADLQRYLELASGARLEIVTEPAAPAIILGAATGLDLADVPLEGFRILTSGGNILIAGPDTPEGGRTPQGGVSNGTRNGVSTFIEEYLDVRWLMPTEVGESVPQATTVTIPETELTDAPFFLNRRVPYTQQERPEVKEWWARQKLGYSLYLSHGHNFTTIPTSEYDEHPDYFPMFDGVRVPPTGRYKLCLSNPALINAFAQKVIAYFDANPQATSFSLSPSDSGGWCQCPGCVALYEQDPEGGLSVTPAVLHFYNGVAKIVGQKYPDKVLAGYVYAAYVYPPRDPIPLEPNVFLVWAPSFDYGYTLFRPELQQRWEELLAQWTRVTDKLAYYDLPTSVANDAGAPCPPGLKILKFIYPRLKQAGIKGVYVYGQEAWGTGAATNYLLAKLAWDPDADVDALFVEFMDRCYAEGADEIEQMYRLLDAEMERHYLANPNAAWTLTSAIMEDVYARNFAEMERLYRAAEAKVQDPGARQRLEWLGVNLTILHWNLRQFGMLDNPTASSFYMTDADFFPWFATYRDSLAIRTSARSRQAKGLEAVAVSALPTPPNAEPTRDFLLRGDQHVIILPTAEQARVRFSRITARGRLVQYTVLGADGEEITAGVMSAEVPIELDAAGSSYYHLMIDAGSATFMMQVEGAAWAVSGRAGDQGLHFLGQNTPLYFEVPDGVTSFHLSLAGDPPGETAVATLYAPDGREAGRFRAVEVPVDRQEITVGAGDAGVWKLVIEAAETGVLDDVYVAPGDELPGWFSLDPNAVLSVRPQP